MHPDTGLIDYEQVEALAREHKPKMIVAGLLGLFARASTGRGCARIADEVGALLFVDMAHVAGTGGGGALSEPDAASPTS